MTMRSRTSVEMAIALRALAIAFIVFNHAYGRLGGPFRMAGGMTFLLMITGYSIARFGLDGAEVQRLRRSLVSLAKWMVLPSIAMVFLSWPFRGLDWRDLLLISNWYPNGGNALFPVDYSALIWQMCVMFWLFSWLPGFTQVWRRPLVASFALFAIGVLLARWFPRHDLMNRLPWLYIWNFSLGFIVFFTLRLKDEGQKAMLKPVVLMCTIVGAYVGWGLYKMPFYWLVTAMVLLLYVDRIAVPRWLAHLIRMLSQATLVIYFAHIPIIHALRVVIPKHPNLTWFLSLFGSLAIWVVLIAAKRAFTHVRAQMISASDGKSLAERRSVRAGYNQASAAGSSSAAISPGSALGS